VIESQIGDVGFGSNHDPFSAFGSHPLSYA
jgi:hypothetical protein